MVTDATCADDEKLLPLSLLRWQEASNRFDKKYYLNSLVNLHLLVKDLLGLKLPDPMSKSDVNSFIGNITGLLGTGSPRKLIHDGITLAEHYSSAYFEEGDDEPVAPFSSLPSHYLPSGVEGFRRYFSAWLLKLLKEFRPYEKLITYARSNELISGEFAQYQSQPRSHQEILSKDLIHKYGEHWRKLLIDDHNLNIEKIKGVGDLDLGEQWAFKTIFQKAMVRFGKTLFVLSSEDERKRFGDVSDYLSFLNTLYDADVLRVNAKTSCTAYNLWAFVAVDCGNNKILATGASEARFLGLITLWYFAVRYAVSERKTIIINDTKNEDHLCAKDILRYFSKKGSQARWPTVNDSYTALLDLFSSASNAQVIKGSAQFLSEEERKMVGKTRLECIFIDGIRYFAADIVA